MTQMFMYLKTKTDVAPNIIDKFFSNFDYQRTFPQKRFQVKKKCGGTGLIFEKTEAFYVELSEGVELATNIFSSIQLLNNHD